MTRRHERWIMGLGLAVLGVALAPLATAQKAAVSDRPDTPFKLATFEAAGRTRVGVVLDGLCESTDHIIHREKFPMFSRGSAPGLRLMPVKKETKP